MSRTIHHPPHIYLDDTWYMITGAIYQKRCLLQPEGYKEIVRGQLKASVIEFGFQLAALGRRCLVSSGGCTDGPPLN